MSLLCFDLDGTIVDPLLGVRNCVARVCREMGLAVPEEATVRNWIGFGMKESIAQIAGLDASGKAEEAYGRYLEAYREQGVFEHEVYPGAHLMLARLKRQGHRIYIVSSKPGLFARRITYQFDLNLIFDDIFGAELKGAWQPKTRVLDRLEQAGTIHPGGYFIGDRGDDMRAARDHGLRAIGVTYGYGTREELQAAGAELLVDSIPDLDAWLKQELPDAEIHDAFTRSE